MSAKRAFSAAGVLLLVGTLVLQPRMADGQGGQKAAPVEVVNTTAAPVPTVAQGITAVNGSVAISGTPTVALAASGNAVQIAGTPTVAFAASGNTVQIGNTSSAPVPTSGQEDATRQIVVREVNVNLLSGSSNGMATLTCVSADMRLIIEDVSMLTTVPTGQKMTAHFLVTAGGTILYRHFLTLIPQLSTGVLDQQTTTQHMHLYVVGGQCINVLAARNATAGDAAYTATISGYLVSAP